jgi:hypothetical protein
MDGKAMRPDGALAATLIPPAFGLAGVNLHTWTGWGSVTHWNAFVANLEMHGQGTFFDPLLDDATRFPIAAANGFGHVPSDPDLVTPKLADLHLYQLALEAPRPPEEVPLTHRQRDRGERRRAIATRREPESARRVRRPSSIRRRRRRPTGASSGPRWCRR